MSVKQGGNTIAGGGVSNVDGVSIDTNLNDELETIGVIDNNGNAIKTWTGTLAQYNAIATKDPNTLYNITDDVDLSLPILERIYPVGSLYLTTTETCPLASLFGTWEVVSQDRVLQGAGSRGAVGSTLEESLPNISGSVHLDTASNNPVIPTSRFKGALYGSRSSNINTYLQTSTSGGQTVERNAEINLDASLSSSTYQDNAPVQQNAYLINVFRRVN